VRVLSVGNMYPPHHFGGYELMWEASVRHLEASGHAVRVLTTDFRKPGAREQAVEPGVRRDLRWYWDDHGWPRLSLGARLKLERRNHSILRQELEAFKPDVVAWWAMGGMSLSLVEAVRRAGVPAAGFLLDDWLVYGPQVDGWLRAMQRLPGPARRMVDALTGVPTELRLGAAARWVFVSDAIRRATVASGTHPDSSSLAHCGVDLELFGPVDQQAWGGRLLCVGRLDPRKGGEVAIRALTYLPDATLRFVGEGDERFASDLRALARDLGLADRVEFVTRERRELPAEYSRADAVLFCVQWEEPWGIVPLEAMAVGRPVIASGTGGSAEFLAHESNCLLYAPRDSASALASAVSRVAADEQLRARLREGGFKTARRISQAAFCAAVERELTRTARSLRGPAGAGAVKGRGPLDSKAMVSSE
jgi:glycogen synthase